MTTAGHSAREQAQLIIREQLRAVGIELKIDNRPANVLFPQVLRRRQFPHMLMAAGSFDPTWLPAPDFHSSQIPTPQNNFDGFNFSGWRNTENDRIIERIVVELDALKRIQMFRRQQEILMEDLPTIPLYYLPGAWTSKAALRNVRPSAWAGILYALERWEWLE